MPSHAQPKPFMKNPKKMCPYHPSVVIVVVRGSSPRGRCLVQKVTYLVSHQFVTRALNLQGEESLLAQEIPQSRAQSLRHHQPGNKSFSPPRPQCSVSLWSTHEGFHSMRRHSRVSTMSKHQVTSGNNRAKGPHSQCHDRLSLGVEFC